jgi:ABC-2 type transport system permease protein
MMKSKRTDNLRIVLAITLKDLVDAIKNKNIITIIITSLFVVVMYKYLPGFLSEEGPPKLLVYDQGDSALLSGLFDSPAVDIYTYESEEDMKYYLTNGEEPELGLVIPKDFDQRPITGQPLQLQGYVLNIFKEDEVARLTRYMEDEFEYILGHSVEISIEKIQIQPETYGITVMTSLGFAFVTIMTGMLIIPHMMIEEKQSKTIEALMVSPAGSSHIILAKAFTGLVYIIVMLIIALAFNWVLVQHQWLFLIGGLIGGLFAISLGMLLGILMDTRQQLILWAWVGLIPLFLPMMLSLMDDLFPERIVKILQWFPSTAMFRVFRTSMAGTVPLQYWAPQLAVLIASSVVLLIIDAWLVYRSTR